MKSAPVTAGPMPAPPIGELVLEHIITLSTSTHTPSPSFSHDGRYLLYRSVRRTRRGAEDEAQVHALDLHALEDQVVMDFDLEHQHYDPYGGYAGYGVSNFDHTFHPAMMADGSVISGLPNLGNAWDPYAPAARKGAVDSSRIVDWGGEGAVPVVSPDGKRVLLHNANRIIELDGSGRKLHTYAGYFGTWHPDGKKVLVHLSPYIAYDPQWVFEPWPEQVIIPLGNPGGLMLYDPDGDPKVLMERGGLPSWHPAGDSFVFERPLTHDYRESPIELMRYDLATETAERIAPEGRNPSFHPDGSLVAFESPGPSISVTDLETTRDLKISGEDPMFSPDGRLVVVEVTDSDRGAFERGVAIYRLRTGSADAASDATDSEPSP